MSLLEIKKKIQSTKNTKKITRAMQLVAASKMKTFQRKAIHAKGHALGLVDALRFSRGSMAETSYGMTRKDGIQLFVILTSDKGLCGAMNQRLVRSLLQSEIWKSTPASERMVITVGRKSADMLRAQGVEVAERFDGLPEKLDAFDAVSVVSSILKRWEEGTIQKIHMVAPEYVNPFTFYTPVRTYLPFTEELVESMQPTEEGEAVEDSAPDVEAAFIEPSREAFVETLAQYLTESLFVAAFYQLKATEYSSRMVAMKKATEAADDRVKELTRQFNKARQNAITQQLAELASANEAMSNVDQYETFEF